MDPRALLVVAALAEATAACCAVVRIVPAGHRGVVIGAGRTVQSGQSGLTVLPGVEMVEMVSMHPRPIDPLGVMAVTRDGVDMRPAATAVPRLTPLGVELVDVDLGDAQLRAEPELLRLLG